MLPEADQRVRKTVFVPLIVRDVINAPAEELGPEQLCTTSHRFTLHCRRNNISYRIIKGDDLLEQGYTGIHTVGRGSSRPPVLRITTQEPTQMLLYLLR